MYAFVEYDNKNSNYLHFQLSYIEQCSTLCKFVIGLENTKLKIEETLFSDCMLSLQKYNIKE